MTSFAETVGPDGLKGIPVVVMEASVAVVEAFDFVTETLVMARVQPAVVLVAFAVAVVGAFAEALMDLAVAQVGPD